MLSGARVEDFKHVPSEPELPAPTQPIAPMTPQAPAAAGQGAPAAAAAPLLEVEDLHVHFVTSRGVVRAAGHGGRDFGRQRRGGRLRPLHRGDQRLTDGGCTPVAS